MIAKDGLKQHRCRAGPLNGDSTGNQYVLVVAELYGGPGLHHQHVTALNCVAVLQHHSPRPNGGRASGRTRTSWSQWGEREKQ